MQQSLPSDAKQSFSIEPLFNPEFIALVKLHATVKTTESCIKAVNNQMQALVDEAELAIEYARDDYRHFGGFDDCGPSYEQALSRSEGRLSQVKLAKAMSTRPLITTLKSMQCEYARAKHQFAAKYGEAALAALYLHNLKVGVITHRAYLTNSKSDKWRRYRIVQLLQFLGGKDFREACNRARVSIPARPSIDGKDLENPTTLDNVEKQVHTYIVNVLTSITAKLNQTSNGVFSKRDYLQVKEEWDELEPKRRTADSHPTYSLARVAKRLVTLDQDLKANYAKKVDQPFPTKYDYQNHLTF